MFLGVSHEYKQVLCNLATKKKAVVSLAMMLYDDIDDDSVVVLSVSRQTHIDQSDIYKSRCGVAFNLLICKCLVDNDTLLCTS